MKKFLVLLFLIASFTVSAQFSTGVRLPIATTDSMEVGQLTVTKYITLGSGYSTVSIQPTVTEFSGTTAGKVKLYGSIDEVNYVQLDSMVLTDVTTVQTKVFNITPNKYAKIKIQGVGTGTMNAVLRVWYLARKTITE